MLKPFYQTTYQIKKTIHSLTIQPKLKMKKFIILSIGFLFLLNSCDEGLSLISNGQRVEGKGAYEKQTRDAKDFKGIDLMASGDVFVKQGAAYKVVVEGQKNILDILETVVENGILQIKFKSGSWNINTEKLNIYVETPSVSSLVLSGSGNISLESAIKSDDFDIKISGSGNIKTVDGLTAKTLNVEIGGSGDVHIGTANATTLKAAILGSGNIDIQGTGEKAAYEVTGSGDINASDFKTKTAEAHSTGSGNINCHASESIDAHVTGSGDINYGGNPPSVKSSVTGSGEITKK